MVTIHPMSVVDPKAELAEDVVVGPFCIIGPEVKIGKGTVLDSSVRIMGRTQIGERNHIFHGASLGCEPQDKKYAFEDTQLIVGDDNVIREHCTLSTGTIQDEGITRVGSRNLLMANAHVAHDCRVGSDTILANNCGLAGHVHVEDFAILGGQSGVHQFVHIGTHAFVGGASAVAKDVPPYVMCNGNPALVHGLNLVGLRRAGFTTETVGFIKRVYHAIYREGNLIADAAREIDTIIAEAPEAIRPMLTHMKDFVVSSPRGIIR